MRPLSTLPLLVGRTLAHCNLVEDAPLRFHPDMGVARKHGARDVPGGKTGRSEFGLRHGSGMGAPRTVGPFQPQWWFPARERAPGES